MNKSFKFAGLFAIFLIAPALAQPSAPPKTARATGVPEAASHRLLRDVANDVSQDSMHANLTALVGFGTRHSLSDRASKTRGIAAAQDWVKARFARINSDCGRCLEIAAPSENFTGSRVPNSTGFMDVLAIQKGTTDPDRVVIIAGHLDSRNTDIMDAVHDAPGADDDGSGSAAVLEAARVLSTRKFPATIVYAVLTGEEQGLYGGTVLARKRWRYSKNSIARTRCAQESPGRSCAAARATRRKRCSASC